MKSRNPPRNLQNLSDRLLTRSHRRSISNSTVHELVCTDLPGETNFQNEGLCVGVDCVGNESETDMISGCAAFGFAKPLANSDPEFSEAFLIR